MTIPAQIKIGAVTWSVQEAHANVFEENKCGDTDHVSCVIRINQDMDPINKELTFMHELLHAIDGELEHNIVELLALSLHQVFSENKITFI